MTTEFLNTTQLTRVCLGLTYMIWHNCSYKHSKKPWKHKRHWSVRCIGSHCIWQLYKAVEHRNLLRWILIIQTQTTSFERSIQFCSVRKSYHKVSQRLLSSQPAWSTLSEKMHFSKSYTAFYQLSSDHCSTTYRVHFVRQQESILIQILRYISGMQGKYWFKCGWFPTGFPCIHVWNAGKFRSDGLHFSGLEVRETFSFSFWLNSRLALLYFKNYL